MNRIPASSAVIARPESPPTLPTRPALNRDAGSVSHRARTDTPHAVVPRRPGGKRLRSRPVPLRDQRGAALIVSLILVVVVTLAALASLTGSQILERIAGNQKQITDSFQAAEHGINLTLEAIRAARDEGATAENWLDAASPTGDTLVVNLLGSPLADHFNEFGGHTEADRREFLPDTSAFWIDGITLEVVEEENLGEDESGVFLNITSVGTTDADPDNTRSGAAVSRIRTRISMVSTVSPGSPGEDGTGGTDPTDGSGGSDGTGPGEGSEDPGSTQPFDAVIVGCYGVATEGSGIIDSYDSRIGSYANSKSSLASVITTEAGAETRLIGNAPIHGTVNATGNVVITGSSPIHGDINATGDVTISASRQDLVGGSIRAAGRVFLNNTAGIGGSIIANGNVEFNNGARVNGSVTTMGNVTFSNSGAKVHGHVSANGNVRFTTWMSNLPTIVGNATAGGTITTSTTQAINLLVGGTRTEAEDPDHQPISPVDAPVCDPLAIDTIFATLDTDVLGDAVTNTGNMNVGNWPFTETILSPQGVSRYDQTWNVNGWVVDQTRVMHTVSVFGNNVQLLKVGNVTLTSTGILRVSGGDVALYVDGNFDLGGNTRIQVDADSTLTIFITGRFNLAGRVVVDEHNPVNDQGKVPFALLSSFDQALHGGSAGVRVSGNTDMAAVIYAPLSDVTIGGSGNVFGSVRGRSIVVSGSGGIHYDLALGDVSLGGGTGGGTTPGDPGGDGDDGSDGEPGDPGEDGSGGEPPSTTTELKILNWRQL